MPDERPNILIVMADQLTTALTGAYGHPVVKTPAMNRLCAEGVRFDAAYSNCPLCTPARAAMLSGRYVSRTRSYDNGGILPDDVPTYAHHLRAAGYEAAAAGKLHLVGADQLHGFERRLTTDIYPSTFKWSPSWPRYEAEGIRNEKGRNARKAAVCDWSDQLEYDTEVQFRALEFLQQRRPGRKKRDPRPFCLLVSFTHPHEPYLITREYWDPYEGAEIEVPVVTEEMKARRTQMDRWLVDYEGIPEEDLKDVEAMRRMRRVYYGMVSYIDARLAELVQALQTFELKENTAILFTSDHGDMLGERGIVEKRCFYEWSAQVPLIASFPGHWRQGAASREPVSLIDIFPTLTEFAGAQPPIDIDGRSFLSLLNGQSGARPAPGGPSEQERSAISEYHGESVIGCSWMIRKGKYKYVYVHKHESQLFDMETDPKELTNLSGQPEFAAIERSLRDEILSRFDPGRIEADVRRSQAERLIMKKAMQSGLPTTWDHQPFFDATKSHVR